MKHALLLIATAPVALAAHGAAAQIVTPPAPAVTPVTPATQPTAPVATVPAQPSVTLAPTTQQASPTPALPTNDVELPENGEAAEGEEIVVTGQRERGSVPGDIRPEQVLRAADIRAYGVSSISDLINELAPQLGGARGGADSRPVILLNGRRISGFREISELPSEAIERTEILPPEAAQQLGFSADQRVVNIVLRRRFNAITAEAQGGGSTDGDRYTAMTNAGLTRIMQEKRLNLNVQYNGATPVYEDDRDIIPIAQTRPYSITGNLTPATGRTTIDPLLGTATVAGVRDGISGRAVAGDFGAATPSDFGAYRTLAAATRSVRFNGSYAQPIGKVQAALSFELQSSANNSELGLASTSYTVPGASPFSPFANPVVVNRYLAEAGPRRRDADTTQGSVGLTLNGDVGQWRWNVTGEYSRNLIETISDNTIAFTPIANRIATGDPTINPFGRFDPQLLGAYAQDLATALTTTATVSSNVSGPILTLPAGRANLSLTSRYTNLDFESLSVRSGTVTPRDTTRRIGTGQVRLSVPLASRRNDVLAAIGELSVNGVLGIEETSDFGSLKTYGYGFNWAPVRGITLTGSINNDENAPGNEQLTNPLILTPNARVFDFVTGQTVEVVRIDGGNPNLLASSREIRSIAANVTPSTSLNLNLNIEYSETLRRNQISGLPAPTAALQAAFPDRYVRDAGGQLIRFDNRPVNFARADQRQLRTGISFSHQFGRMPERPAGGFGPRRAQGDGAAPGAAGTQPRGGGGGNRGGGFGGGGFGGGGFGRGGFGGPQAAAFLNSPQARAIARIVRVRLNLTHTWTFENSVLIRDGLPRLDQLNGDTLGDTGAARHRVDFNAGINRGPYGLTAGGDWNSGSIVRGGTVARLSDITFAPLFRTNLRAVTDFNPLMKVVRDHPWLNGVRMELSATNLLNARPQITAADGVTPLNYQPFLRDPIGRVIALKIRKRFS